MQNDTPAAHAHTPQFDHKRHKISSQNFWWMATLY